MVSLDPLELEIYKRDKRLYRSRDLKDQWDRYVKVARKRAPEVSGHFPDMTLVSDLAT